MKGGIKKMEVQKQTVELTVYKDTCPYCNKVIESQYLNQFKYNYDEHTKACMRKSEKSK